jgi:dihydrofolate synthase/folylpolyglutamate synthase
VAREKAGILRAGRTAILAAQSDEARRVIAGAAEAIGARIVDAARLAGIRATFDRGLGGTDVTLELAGRELATRVALAGDHQLGNAATAAAAALAVDRQRVATIAPEAIATGLATARWPGRLEAIETGAATVLLDAAHNPHGVEALARFLDRLGRPCVLLFGALADKETSAMLPPLARRARAVVLTRPVSDRALDPAALAATLDPAVPSRLEPEPAAALDTALERARALGIDLVVACGSLYLIGPLRSRLRELAGALPD